ncbi:MAG: response regulator [Candidatus Sulfotelmatobacter sp.]
MARKILLADDSVTAQNMGRKILADAGYEVITVNNGSAALKKIAELKPDLVILDVYMPGYSGLEVCQRLKESQESARIPVLLTVGKLEPFKPEEAQRVRADSFIVKPFEASELLSALSKLEDKVVPRAEPSKPGRFARAIAAAEEAGRGGRNDTPSDEENGWRSRISFPRKKTEPEEKVADDASFYNPINRDLRTVVETPAELAADKAAEKEEKRQQAAKAAETSVDVAALVPSGLPKDVTPEEVAAIAAAAAQIQMLGAAAKDEPPVSEAPSTATMEPAPNPVEENVPRLPEIAADSAPAVNVEAKAEAVPESEEENEVASVATGAVVVATEVRRYGYGKPEEAQDLPVTMAATAESMMVANQSASRWTAVAVALEGDEATISLDQEMQKSYAAFVAEETASAAAATAPEAEATPAPPENSSAPAEVTAEATPEVPVAAISNPEPEPPQPEPAESSMAQESEAVPVAQLDTIAMASSLPAAEPASFPDPAAESTPQPETALIAPVASDFAPAEAHTETSPAAELAESKPDADAESAIPVETAVAEPATEESHPVAEAEPVMAETVAASSTTFAPIVYPEPTEEYQEESETVKSTAAAWASWRQIRDTGEAKSAVEPGREEFDTPVPEPAESAAMAAAAGAEQTAQESAAPAENPADVAGIVDSVLADLRPRLMAEISRKMAEKK